MIVAIQDSFQGNFIKWFSSGAFGGMNYSNTPVGAVAYGEDPNISGVNYPDIYFGLWTGKRKLAICAWQSKVFVFLALGVIGDPLVMK
ncbi:MAG: hypothetical protein ABIP71_03820 [Verrucomicrobiota bacterium]